MEARVAMNRYQQRKRNKRGRTGRPRRNATCGASAALRAFQDRVAIAPDRKIDLVGPLTVRILDVFCPIGFGQRAIILAPPRTGDASGQVWF